MFHDHRPNVIQPPVQKRPYRLLELRHCSPRERSPIQTDRSEDMTKFIKARLSH